MLGTCGRLEGFGVDGGDAHRGGFGIGDVLQETLHDKPRETLTGDPEVRASTLPVTRFLHPGDPAGAREDEMTWKTLELEREGAILRVWLNRPEKRNAIDEEMLREVGDLSHALEADFETRVIVLGGRGESFCSGADRKGGSTPWSRCENRTRTALAGSVGATRMPGDRGLRGADGCARTRTRDRGWLLLRPVVRLSHRHARRDLPGARSRARRTALLVRHTAPDP